MIQIASPEGVSVEFNHWTYTDVSNGGFRMDGENVRKVDERMLSGLIDAYGNVEADFDMLVSRASALEAVATRAVDMFTLVSDDPDKVHAINRDLNRARKDFATGIIDLMVDLEEIEDIIDERIDFDCGGFGLDDEDDDREDDDDGEEGSSPFDLDLEIPIPPALPESGDETDLGYMSARIDFLTQCLKVVTATNLGYAQILAELAGRVDDIEGKVIGDDDGNVDDGGED